MTVALTITAADGAQITINLNDPVINPNLPASLAFQFEPAKGGMFQSNAGVTSAVANGDVIGYLPDFSGNSFHLTSIADDATRPTLQGVGVHPYVNFDGSNDVLRHSSASGAYAAGSASWFAALRSNGNSVSSGVLSESSTLGLTPIYEPIIANSVTASSAAASIRNDASTFLLSNATVLQANVFSGADVVYGIVDDGSGITPYLNGVAGTRVAYTRSGTMTPNVFAMGALIRSTISGWFNGRIYGAFGWNRALTSAEVAQANTYATKLYS
jgi:hypothetical protein